MRAVIEKRGIGTVDVAFKGLTHEELRSLAHALANNPESSEAATTLCFNIGIALEQDPVLKGLRRV